MTSIRVAFPCGHAPREYPYRDAMNTAAMKYCRQCGTWQEATPIVVEWHAFCLPPAIGLDCPHTVILNPLVDDYVVDGRIHCHWCARLVPVTAIREGCRWGAWAPSESLVKRRTARHARYNPSHCIITVLDRHTKDGRGEYRKSTAYESAAFRQFPLEQGELITVAPRKPRQYDPTEPAPF